MKGRLPSWAFSAASCPERVRDITGSFVCATGHHVGHRQDDHRRYGDRYDDAHQLLLVRSRTLENAGQTTLNTSPYQLLVGDSTYGGTINILAGGMFTLDDSDGIQNNDANRA